MLIRSVFDAFVRRMTSPTPVARRRRSNQNQTAEQLELRQLLTAVVTLANVEATPLNYVENGTDHITSTLTVALSGASTIDQAKVQITGNYQTGQDRLLFANTTQLTGSWDATTGTLTITGNASADAYQAAFRSIYYRNIHNNPSTLTRTISFQADSNPSNVVSRNVKVTAVNDAPVVTVDAGSVDALEQVATPISPGLLVTDPDNMTLASAKVQITSNYHTLQDRLQFTNTAKIQGSWDESTGTLTLSGVDSVSNYRTALRSVTFLDFQNNPSTNQRVVTFTASDGSLNSNPVTRTINVIPVNDPPLVSAIESTPLTVAQNDPAVQVTSTLLLADGDDFTLPGAVVRISGNYQNGIDVLHFNNTANITGNWNANTGTLTLSGIDSVSNYRSALRSVTFTSSADYPGTLTRTISFQASDFSSFGNTVSRSVVVQAVPHLSGIETTPLAYTVANSNVAITATLTLQDYNQQPLTGAQVKIFDVQSGDSLSAASVPGILWTWDATTGILTFTGSESVATYQALLQTVTYNNPSSDPTSLHRQFQFQVFEGTLASNIVFRDMNFSAANDPPELSQVGSTLTYVAGSGAVPVSSTINVFDPDRQFLTGAVIQFVPLYGNYRPPQDILSFVDTATIKGSWTPQTGRLVLSGTDTVANYMAALRSVTYTNTAPRVVTGNREISFQVADGDQRGAPDSNVVIRQINVVQS